MVDDIDINPSLLKIPEHESNRNSGNTREK